MGLKIRSRRIFELLTISIQPCVCFAIFLTSATLYGQSYYGYKVEIIDENIHITPPEKSEIYRVNADSSIEKIKNPVTDGGLQDPPKVRFGYVWGMFRAAEQIRPMRLQSRPLDADSDIQWDSAILPEGLEYFTDFEILSEDEALICGAEWVNEAKCKSDVPIRYDYCFIFNYKTGKIKRSLEAFDPKMFKEAMNNFDEFSSPNPYTLQYMSESRAFRYGTNILIVGEHNGVIAIFDTLNNKYRKIVVVPKEEQPDTPFASVWGNGSAIPWLAPLQNGDLLICCRFSKNHDPQLEYDADSDSWVWNALRIENDARNNNSFWFRSMNIETGKVTFEGAYYREIKAESANIVFEVENEMITLGDVLKKSKEPYKKESDKSADEPPKTDNTDMKKTDTEIVS